MFKHTTARFDHRNLIHWIWLWVLAAIAITALQRTVWGQPVNEKNPRFEYREDPLDGFERFGPRPHWQTQHATLRDVLESNRRGDHESALTVWKQLKMHEQSASWRQVGMGVAHLRMGNIDDAHRHLVKAKRLDRSNAVADYFLGRLFQAKSRRVPFWYQMNGRNPFRFASLDVDPPGEMLSPDYSQSQELLKTNPEKARTYLPRSRRYDFDLKARQHFRLAVDSASCCDLDQPIRVVEPLVQLVSHRRGVETGQGRENDKGDEITVRDLLISLDEEDFAEKANREIAGRLAVTPSPGLESSDPLKLTRPDHLIAKGGGKPFAMSGVYRQARQCLQRYPGDENGTRRCSA